MPTFNDPTADAEEARQALRGLAHATGLEIGVRAGMEAADADRG